MPVLTVTGVDDAAAGDIISEHVQTPVAPEVRAELLAATRGNPLGLVELTRALSADQLSGRDQLPHRLPVTKGVEAAFLDRYRRLPEPAQTLWAGAELHVYVGAAIEDGVHHRYPAAEHADNPSA